MEAGVDNDELGAFRRVGMLAAVSCDGFFAGFVREVETDDDGRRVLVADRVFEAIQARFERTVHRHPRALATSTDIQGTCNIDDSSQSGGAASSPNSITNLWPMMPDLDSSTVTRRSS